MAIFKKKDNVRFATQEANRKARRLRIYRRLVKVAYVCVAIAVVAMGVELRRYLLTTPRLGLAQIEITGAERVDPWEVRALGKLKTGKNLLQFDLEETSHWIERHPWVESVRIRRILPDRLHIDVKERQAIALLPMGELYYVDEEGVIFKRVHAGEVLSFPALTGFDTPGPLQRGFIGRKAIKEALELLETITKRTSLVNGQISEIHVDPVAGFSFYTANAAAQIHLGWDELEKKLDRLKRLLEDERLDLKQVRRIDLDLKRWAVVTPI